jgi:hypothetical protein
LRFSQRMGITEVRSVIQRDSMTAELRNSLWNILDQKVWRAKGFREKKVEERGQVLLFASLKIGTKNEVKRGEVKRGRFYLSTFDLHYPSIPLFSDIVIVG